MGCNITETNIRLEAVDAYFGKKHCRTVETVADVAGDLSGTYFDLNFINGDFEQVLGYMYTGADPLLAGKTGIEFTVANDDTAEAVALAIKTAIDASNAMMVATVDGAVVTIENMAPFAITAEVDSGATGFTITAQREGSGAKLGKTAEGGSSVTLEAQSFDVVSDQTGSNLLDSISTGTTASVEMGIIELTKEQFELLIGSATGDIVTGSTSKITGYGESRLYQSLFALGGALILRPIRLRGTQDYTSDVILHKCAPQPSDINYSGSDQQTLNVVFKPYLDSSIDSKVNLIAFGDWTQSEILA